MKYICKRAAASLLALTIVMGVTPAKIVSGELFRCRSIIAHAEIEGYYPTNLTWKLDDNGTLTLSGTGDMYENYYTLDDQWYEICSLVKRVIIEEGIESIGQSAFWGFPNLTSVTIPDSVKSIDNYAFGNCRSLVSVDIPNSVTSIGNRVFENCTSLVSIDIPDSVTSLGNRVFEGCTSLDSFVIPNSLTSIPDGTFKGCSSLTSVIIPDGVRTIEKSAFYGCSGSVIVKSDTPAILDSYVFDNTSADFMIFVPAEKVDVYKSAWSRYADKISTNGLTDGEYTQTAHKNGKYYTRFVFVVPEKDFSGKGKVKYTVTYNNEEYTYESNYFYTSVTSNGEKYVPVSKKSRMFVVTVSSSSDISSKLKCKLDFE